MSASDFAWYVLPRTLLLITEVIALMASAVSWSLCKDRADGSVVRDLAMPLLIFLILHVLIAIVLVASHVADLSYWLGSSTFQPVAAGAAFDAATSLAAAMVVHTPVAIISVIGVSRAAAGGVSEAWLAVCTVVHAALIGWEVYRAGSIWTRDRAGSTRDVLHEAAKTASRSSAKEKELNPYGNGSSAFRSSTAGPGWHHVGNDNDKDDKVTGLLQWLVQWLVQWLLRLLSH